MIGAPNRWTHRIHSQEQGEVSARSLACAQLHRSSRTVQVPPPCLGSGAALRGQPLPVSVNCMKTIPTDIPTGSQDADNPSLSLLLCIQLTAKADYHTFVGASGVLIWSPLNKYIGVVWLGSRGSSVPSLLRNLYPDFHGGCSDSHSRQPYLRAPFSPRPRQHSLLFVFLMTAVLAGARGNLNVVSICISLMASSVEHFHMSTDNFKQIKGLERRPKILKLSRGNHRHHFKIQTHAGSFCRRLG